ncbi:nudC domain-containing protein 1-like [Haliotis asinina]|uniref:nudC domain-containing protein 1-like n=1 Tax=Haliotis asinina TaxID=109174 RepID=UPI0035326970
MLISNNMAVQGDLRIQRELVNPHFDGYKLSLDHLPVYTKTLNKGIDVSKLTDEQFSYHHAKLLSVHNHLISDPWQPVSVYFVDSDWAIHRAFGTDGNRVDISDSLFVILESANLRLQHGRFNVTLTFPTEQLAVLSDGAGNLYLLDTGDRKGAPKQWKSLYTKPVLGDGKQFIVVDSVHHSDNETDRVECLLMYVEEREAEAGSSMSPFLTVIEWITIASVDKKTWCVERTRRLEGSKPYDYTALDKGGNSVLISASQRYKLVSDSVKPVQPDSEGDWEVVGRDDKLPEYTWTQDNEDIHVQFTVPTTVSKADIYLTLSADHVDFGVKNSTVLLKGALHNEVDVEASTWTIEGQRLVLSLSKENQTAWPTVVIGDNRGEMILDPGQINQIHDRLASYTSEQMNPPPEDAHGKPFNTQELEDCDASTEDSTWFMRIDGETHKISNEVYLSSHQWLFNVCLESSKTPAVCLRYDCDGSLWQPGDAAKDGKQILDHVGMLHAFGYVQASKVQRKFSSCSPDMSYAVISDCTRHLYIYRQHMPIASPLRNRKTGRQVNAVAKQQVVALDTTDDVLGLRATNDRIFVMTSSSLFVVRLHTEE